MLNRRTGHVCIFLATLLIPVLKLGSIQVKLVFMGLYSLHGENGIIKLLSS
jgi:hypothetical protein